MINRNAERTIVKRLPDFFGVGALFLAIWAGSWTLAVAQQPAATPVQKSVEAQALPAPGTYKIDPRHSFAYFSAWHHLVGRVRGRFDQVSGTITVSPDPAACSVDVTIDVATISTQVSQRDDDLRSDAYFDVKKFLTMTYQGRGIHRVSADLWRMDGSLTMHGITKVVPLTFKYNGIFADTKPNQPARVAEPADKRVCAPGVSQIEASHRSEVPNAQASLRVSTASRVPSVARALTERS
jgi:polyisoprenoid-binding protein YceI